MKTVIIPIDFSETSLNAARYTAQMLSKKAETHIILFNLYKDEDEVETHVAYLDSLKKELEWVRQNPKGRQAKSKARIKGEGAILVDDGLPLRIGHIGFQAFRVETHFHGDLQNGILTHVGMGGEQRFMKGLVLALRLRRERSLGGELRRLAQNGQVLIDHPNSRIDLLEFRDC